MNLINSKENKKYELIFLIILIFLYTRPRYIDFLPTIPVYNNNEAKLVFKKSQNRTLLDEEFFKLTDPSISYAFVNHVEENIKILDKIIKRPLVRYTILFFKFLINRPRPYQINDKINTLYSDTGNTASFPAGHAFQAYYLAHILSKKYPEKKTYSMQYPKDVMMFVLKEEYIIRVMVNFQKL